MYMLIGGKETEAADRNSFEVLNPTTHEVIDTVPAATREDINTILENARKGSHEWAAVPLWKRIDILKRCILAIEEHSDELGMSIVKELGVPISQVQGEINTAVARAAASTEAARFINGECYPPSNCSAADGDLITTVREPLGVVLAIIPFNFPVATFCTKVWPALLMGNAVVAKLPSDDPLTIIKVAKLMLSCGVPGNALQVITGSGSVLGKWLNTDSRIDAISMTGSTQVGASVAVDAGRNLSSCALELGGNDPLIILPDADIDYAVCQAITNRSNRSGQICHSSKRFIVHSSMKEEFTGRLVKELRKKKVGDPMDPDTIFGPVVSERAAENIEKQINLNIKEGAEVLLGGKRFNKTFIEPTVLDCPHEAEAAHDMEIFGPVWTVLSYNTIEEAIDLANDTIYGLSSGVIGKDMNTMLRIAKNIQAGTCVLNGGGSYAAPYSPFGGYKKSGLGRQSAMENLREFSQIKTIVFRHLF